MRIENRIEGLLPQEHAQKSATDRKAFEDMLVQQLGQGQPGEVANLAGSGLDALQILGGVNVEAPEEDALLSGLLSQAEDLLGTWENYAKSLGAGQDKAAWNLLSGLDVSIKGLRGEVGQLGARGQGLDAVLNELEVLAATEKFKFNRGDYQ